MLFKTFIRPSVLYEYNYNMIKLLIRKIAFIFIQQK